MKHLFSTLAAAAAITAVNAADTPPQTILHQGFEDAGEFAALSPNGYTTIPAGKSGRWGVFGREAVSVSRDAAAVGERSAKIIRMEKAQQPLIGVAAAPVKGALEVEVWFMRESKSAFTLRIGGLKEQKFAPAAAILCNGAGALLVFDAASKRYLPTGVTTPADEWTQLRFRFRDGKCRIIAGISGEDKHVDEFPFPAEPPLDRIECVAAPSPVGSATCFDEISITLLPETAETAK